VALKLLPRSAAFVRKLASSSKLNKKPEVVKDSELWAEVYDRTMKASSSQAGSGAPVAPLPRVPLKAASDADGQLEFLFVAPASSAPLRVLFSKGWETGLLSEHQQCHGTATLTDEGTCMHFCRLTYCGLLRLLMIALCAQLHAHMQPGADYNFHLLTCNTTGVDNDSADSTLLQLADVQINDNVLDVKVRTYTLKRPVSSTRSCYTYLCFAHKNTLSASRLLLTAEQFGAMVTYLLICH
jgi:hypothetical protein